MIQEYFYGLADLLPGFLRAGEDFSAYLQAEDSEFIRFNRGMIRQCGSVTQQQLTLDLIRGRRHATAEVGLSGDLQQDRRRLQALVDELRDTLALVPEDPYLLRPTEPVSSESIESSHLPQSEQLTEEILSAVADHDMVGILACGGQYHGFCDARGQRNWHQRGSFNLDFSLYLHADRALKSRHGGYHWDSAAFARGVNQLEAQLAVLARPALTIEPGSYRAFLAPDALEEITDLLAWGAFSLQAHRTRSTPFLAMIEADARLDPRVSFYEDTAGGSAPDFQSSGFRRPPRVDLLTEGRFRQCLVSPRSAAEYGVDCNGAGATESPDALAMAPGDLADTDILATLDHGLYVGNLWYLNYSDRNAGRITGMTRFGTFWVENGQLQRPVNVMRFDDTLYRLLGDSLEALTRERSLLMDSGTYDRRSSRSSLLPGILLKAFRLTL